MTGFEPAASWSRTKHSTGLSHTPIAYLLYHNSYKLSIVFRRKNIAADKFILVLFRRSTLNHVQTFFFIRYVVLFLNINIISLYFKNKFPAALQINIFFALLFSLKCNFPIDNKLSFMYNKVSLMNVRFLSIKMNIPGAD